MPNRSGVRIGSRGQVGPEVLTHLVRGQDVEQLLDQSVHPVLDQAMHPGGVRTFVRPTSLVIPGLLDTRNAIALQPRPGG